MSKDFCFYFYTRDFMVSTQFFTDAEVGKYIRIICTQHQFGRLTPEMLQKVAGKISEKIKRKLKNDEQGNFYDEDFERIFEQRTKYLKSRLSNLKGKKTDTKESSHMDSHMEDHKKDKDKDSPYGFTYTQEDYGKIYPLEKCIEFSLNDKNWLEQTKFKKEDLERFAEYLKNIGQFEKVPKDFKKYCFNWHENEKKRKPDPVLESSYKPKHYIDPKTNVW